MRDNRLNETFRNMFRIGTPECAIFFGLLAMVLALLFLTIGFWRTLLVAALVSVGAFIGGVSNKKEWFRNLINRLFPPKGDVPYREREPSAEKAVQESPKTPEDDETK